MPRLPVGKGRLVAQVLLGLGDWATQDEVMTAAGIEKRSGQTFLGLVKGGWLEVQGSGTRNAARCFDPIIRPITQPPAPPVTQPPVTQPPPVELYQECPHCHGTGRVPVDRTA
jgi:hypothetical protein